MRLRYLQLADPFTRDLVGPVPYQLLAIVPPHHPLSRGRVAFSFGQWGWFQIGAIPSPTHPSTTGGGRSDQFPQGTPLSTRIRSGTPHCSNCSRSAACTAVAST
jgi:hypothetical protein